MLKEDEFVQRVVVLQLTQTLEEDEFACNYQLASRLDHVHELMESDAWNMTVTECQLLTVFATWFGLRPQW